MRPSEEAELAAIAALAEQRYAFEANRRGETFEVAAARSGRPVADGGLGWPVDAKRLKRRLRQLRERLAPQVAVELQRVLGDLVANQLEDLDRMHTAVWDEFRAASRAGRSTAAAARALIAVQRREAELCGLKQPMG